MTDAVAAAAGRDGRHRAWAVLAGATVWSAAAVAMGAATGHPVWAVLLVAATLAVAAVASVPATAVAAALTVAATVALALGPGGSTPLVAAVLSGGVAAAGAMAVAVAAVRIRQEAARAALEQASERERLQRRDVEERSRLYRLAAALADCSSVADVAATTFESLRAEAGADAGLLGMVQGGDGDEWVRMLQAFGHRGDLLGRRPTAPLTDDLPATEVIANGVPMFAEDAAAFAERWPSVGDEVLASGFGSLCILPLLVSARAVGFVSASWRDARTFPEDDRRFLTALAGQCAQALERARLADEERRARRQLTFLGDVTRLLTSSLEPAAVLAQLVDLVVGSMAEACAVVVPADGRLRRQTLAGRTRASAAAAAEVADGGASVVVHGDGPVPNGSLVARVWADQQPVEMVVASPLGGGTDAHVLGLPLAVAGERLGVMVFVSGTDGPPFGPGDAALAAEVAARASTALANATRYERERDTAALLQRAVLPERLPQVDGVALDAVYRAGTAGAQVGGDWFDAVPLADGRLLVSVGDVMGKGAAAAALMSQVRTAVRAYGLVDPRPASVLDLLDRLVATFGETPLVTAVVAVVEPDTGCVTLASAGHPPPVLVGPGRCQVVGGGRRRILGVGPEAGEPPRGDEVTLRMGPRDCLVLYSDGLVERRGETLSEGVARLCIVAADCTDTEPWWQRAAGCLVDALVGDDPDDDVAVLTIATPTVPVPEGEPAPGVWWMVLPPESSSAPAARRWLRSRLAGMASDPPVDDEVADRAELLAAELLTNAVLHARTDVGIGLRVDGGTVRIEVSDQSVAAPVLKQFGPDAATGRGLLLVDELATRWGVESYAAGKVVWFEVEPGVRRADPGAAPAVAGTDAVSGTGAADTDPVAGTGASGAAPGRGASVSGTGASTLAGDLPAAAASGPLRTIHLGNVPSQVALAAAAHYDGLERELQLPGGRTRLPTAGSAEVAAALRRAAAVGGTVGAALAPATARWQQAVAAGEAVVEADLVVPEAVGAACRQVNTILDEIEEWCRRGLLLAVPAPEPVVAFRRWLLGQVADQCAGRPARPWRDVAVPPR